MKKINFYCLVIFSLTLAFACKEKAEDKAPVVASDGTHTTVKVPVDSAAVCIANYDSICREYLDTVPVKGFTIRARDLIEVLGLPLADTGKCAYQHARVYLGINRNNLFKLYFVSVDKADLSKSIAGIDVAIPNPEANGQLSVFDLNTPCPKVCASNNIFSITK